MKQMGCKWARLFFFSNMDGLWTVNYLTNRLEYQWNESYRSHISWVYISPQMVAWNFLHFTYLIGIITSMKESYWKKKKKRQPSFIPREICRVQAHWQISLVEVESDVKKIALRIIVVIISHRYFSLYK